MTNPTEALRASIKMVSNMLRRDGTPVRAEAAEELERAFGAALSSQPPAPREQKPEHESVPLIRATYEKHYPEFNGVASKAVRNHYGAFMTGWYARASLTGTASTQEQA